MTLRKTKRVINLLGIAVIVCAVLMYLVQPVKQAMMVFFILMLIFSIALIVVNLTFWRCPFCEKHLGRDTGKFCQHCGEELDMDR